MATCMQRLSSLLRITCCATVCMKSDGQAGQEPVHPTNIWIDILVSSRHPELICYPLLDRNFSVLLLVKECLVCQS